MINSNEKANAVKYNCVVVIPVLNPQTSLIQFIRALLDYGVAHIIVVNDGSDSIYHDIFCEAAKLPQCTLLEHGATRGKGRALKTAFSYYIDHFSHFDGVVTADVGTCTQDGQGHTPEDICYICGQLSLKKNILFLGERNFHDKHVPILNYLVHLFASKILQFLYGIKIHDIQSGLRGIPTKHLLWMVGMRGERYDFETNMLIKAKQHNLTIISIPVNSLYLKKHSRPQYRIVKDSTLIFFRLILGIIQYWGSGLSSGIIDITVFTVLNSMVLAPWPPSLRILISTVTARTISSGYNYFMNRKIVFADTGRVANSFTRYYILCVLQMLASYSLVLGVSQVLMINASIIKIVIDIVLGLISYQIQLHWVFSSNNHPANTLPASAFGIFSSKGFFRRGK